MIIYSCNQRIFVRQEQLSQITYGISERDNISSRESRTKGYKANINLESPKKETPEVD